MTRRSIRFGAVLASAALVLGACAQSGAASRDAAPTPRRAPQGSSFYAPPRAAIPGPPGSIIWSRPVPGGPAGSSTRLIEYRSRSRTGRPIAVSGLVIAPTGPAPEGGRPVVAWAHPTTGIVARCQPSLQTDPWSAIPGLQAMLDAGYVVAATDYPGTAPGAIQPYLIGVAEGRSVLDSVRAARRLLPRQTSHRFITWGHSQGGHASLFAGQLAKQYAPELKLLGVSAAAPASLLAEQLDADINSMEGTVLGGFALEAYRAHYRGVKPPVDPAKVLTPEARAALPTLRDGCITTWADMFQLAGTVMPLAGKTFTVDPATVQPWKDLLELNTAGRVRTGAPMLITQGTGDTTVVPESNERFSRRACKRGDRVELLLYPGVTHTEIAIDSAPQVVQWMQERVSGAKAPDGCPNPAAGPASTR